MGRGFESDDDDMDDGDDGSAELMGSFADMMTLLLGFFMILYSMSHMDERKFYEYGKTISESFKQVDSNQQNQVHDKLAEKNRQIRAFQMMVAILNLGDAQQAVDKIEEAYSEKIKGEANSEILNAELIPGKKADPSDLNKKVLMELVFPAEKIFIPNSLRLNGFAEDTMKKLALALTRVVGPIEVEITGHVEESKNNIRRLEDKWDYSTAQATSLANSLIDLGIDGQNISVSGRADFDPIYKAANNPRLLSQNTRVEIRIKEKSK